VSQLVFNEAIDDGALADTLIPNEDHLELDGMFLVRGIA
jgi:hypothetical protein